MDRLVRDLDVLTDTESIRKIANYFHSKYLELTENYDTLKGDHDDL